MSTIHVDSLVFMFRPSMAAQKYDDWVHYKEVWNKNGGRKAVDLVATSMTSTPKDCWLIEAKDFRVIHQEPESSNLAGLAQTVVDKVRDTLAGLADAANGAVDTTEKEHALRAVKARGQRVVLHLEPHAGHHSKLFPSNFSTAVLQDLKQLARSIDSNPLVLNIANTAKAQVPWSAGSR